VEYKKGRENVAADSLSRRNEVSDTPALLEISVVETDWIDLVKKMVNTDVFFSDLESRWNDGLLDNTKYQKRNGLFYYKGRILINPSASLTQLLLSEHHDTPVGGTQGMKKPIKD